jgi:hypothetical protein
MLINCHNTEDISKYFLQTYVKFKEEGDKIFYVTKVTASRMLVRESSGEEAAIDLEDGYYLDYIIPKKTVFQYGEHALFLSRIPARMWKKGMDHKNTQFQVLKASGGWVEHDFNISTVEGFVNKASYMSFEDALTNLTSGDVNSVALSPRISINTGGSVYIDTVLVGKYRFQQKELACKSIFKEDLTKVFKCKIKALT